MARPYYTHVVCACCMASFDIKIVIFRAIMLYSIYMNSPRGPHKYSTCTSVCYNKYNLTLYVYLVVKLIHQPRLLVVSHYTNSVPGNMYMFRLW